MDDSSKQKKTVVDDWMVRISFAEAGEGDMGFKETGLDIERKTKFAMEKIMVVKAEKTSATSGGQEGPATATAQREGEKSLTGEKLQLMILDDDPIMGKRLRPALTKAGFEVEVFEDPVKAVARLEKKEFEIIITDFQMDNLDGIQVLEHIMANCENTRVILMTGYASVELAREALVKGAFDFIAKPFKAKELRAMINKAALSMGHTAHLK
jgi:CheY-like chemotaxis protein